MSTRSSARNLFPPLDNSEFTIRKRSRADPNLLNAFKMAAEGNGDLSVPDLRTMEDLCQPSLNGRGGPIALIAIQATNFGLKNDMIQQVQNYCQFHGLPGDDANKHLDKFLHVTQSIKVNGVTDDALHFYLFPYSLTHYAIAWFDRLPRNSINTFEQMAKMFLEKYFPPSMVTKLKNEITNFRQHPEELLFKAWERYKLSIDRCPNHNMFPVTQIDTFYNGLTLRHRDTINAAGGTFMKRRPKECYDLIENMTAHHNDWDTLSQRTKTDKSSIDKPPDVELKDLPPHLEYVFLESYYKLYVIIANDLSDEEKTTLITVLKSHKRAIAWKLFDIKGINPKFCTHKILMEDDFEPMFQHQRRVNPKIHNVIKKEVLELINAGLIYPISDSPWIEVDKAKVDVIAKLPHPTTAKGIHSFLGHAGFYRGFIKDFSKTARLMTRLLKKDTIFFFYKECVEAFQTPKRKLTEAPILIAPDWDLSFELMCDTSDFSIGAVLGQCQEKHFRPIHYASKTMTEAESNYTTTEKEMLAVVYIFEKFRSYLIMNKSIVYTDHPALKYLFAKKDSKSSEGVYTAMKPLTFPRLATVDPPGDIMAQTTLPRRFGTPRAIISDCETHFCNDQFAKVMLKYGVTHCLATAYHPQTSGQVEGGKRAIKYLCPSCEQGKSKRASHPPKPVPNSRQRLHLLHMDLCGPMRIASINGKRYVLGIVEDYTRYTWVHFLRSKDEALEVIKTFLKKITVLLQSPVIIIRTDNDTKLKYQALKEYFDSVGISHQMSYVRTPQQNGVVERKNRTLVEAARTMLIFSRAPLFLWAEAITTACFTQNRSIIHRRFNKTSYELINGRKPDISFLHVFGSLCYPKNDREDIGKLGAKGDIGFFIGYSADSCAYRVFNRRTKKIMETMNVSFDELSAMAFEQRSSKPGLQSMTSGQISSRLDLTYAPSTITTQQPTKGELDLLFEAMYDGYIGGQPSAAPRTVLAAQAHQVRQTLTASTSTTNFALTPTTSSSQATIYPNTLSNVDELNSQQHVQQQENQDPIQPETVADNVSNDMFDANMFVNPFATPSTSAAESSSLQNAMTDPAWIESMQEELLQFKRLDVWVLVPAPDNITPLNLKWLLKNNHDEEKRVIQNKSCLVVRGYRLEEGIDFEESFAPGTTDPTLFIRRFVDDILVVQVYVDDIIFGSTYPRYTQLFSDLMKSRFEKSMMGEMTFFFGLQVNQSPCGIFINQSNYVLEILKKYGMESCDPVGTPMEIKDKLDLDQNGTPVDATKYQSMIGSLLGTVNMGLWYTKDYGFELTGFSYADYAGCKDTFKSTFGGAQFLGEKLVNWSSKKQSAINRGSRICVSIRLLYLSPLDADTVNELWLSLQQDSNLL
uniref:Integrase, catalytic region, zinc finger, CCHC-type, peptidase aspartic, catalytic n=1 Tax=Tanacetum cinerariifolium TaxID=118510 RepID=A0A6L2M4W3_TANCI|nr:integrase, catalytic region, zinc finger, CCHC-type, peptidase aspartic, catalytic [Tanacetum cinerariifolium]